MIVSFTVLSWNVEKKKSILFPLTQRIWRISGSHTCMFWSMSTNMYGGECTEERTNCWQEMNKEDRGKVKRQHGTLRHIRFLKQIWSFVHTVDLASRNPKHYKTVHHKTCEFMWHTQKKKQAAAYGSPLRHINNNTRTYCVSGVDFSPTKSVAWNDQSGCWSSGAFILCSSCVCSIINFTTYHADILSICF